MSAEAGKAIEKETSSSWLFDSDLRTENTLATEFVNRHLDRLRYVPAWKKWLFYDGKRWHKDECSTHATILARNFSIELWNLLGEAVQQIERNEFGLIKTFIKQANNRSCIESYLKLATADSRTLVEPKQLDKSPTLLNVLNGTLDLESGTLLPHSPKDLLTQLAPVEFATGATAPRWEETIAWVFDGDADLIRYFRQILGYSLFGGAPENILPIWYGCGNNGKSTIWNTVGSILGDYFSSASQELILPAKNASPHDRADLFRRRFVMVAEPDENRRLSESQVKMLTGNDVIRGRNLYENAFDFEPTHLLCLATNHKPRIQGTDEGIWRRVKLIPFNVDLSTKTQQVKKGFSNWLANHEASGILNWLLHGFQEWFRGGFEEPEAVRAATFEYRHQEDELQQFVADHCVVEAAQSVRASSLYRAFEDNGYRMTQTQFGKRMSSMFEHAKDRSGKLYLGVGLRQNDGERDGCDGSS